MDNKDFDLLLKKDIESIVIQYGDSKTFLEVATEIKGHDVKGVYDSRYANYGVDYLAGVIESIAPRMKNYEDIFFSVFINVYEDCFDCFDNEEINNLKEEIESLKKRIKSLEISKLRGKIRKIKTEKVSS